MGDGIYVVVHHEGRILLVEYYPFECEEEAHGFAYGWICGAGMFGGDGMTEIIDTTSLSPTARETFLERIAPYVEVNGVKCDDYDCDADE